MATVEYSLAAQAGPVDSQGARTRPAMSSQLVKSKRANGSIDFTAEENTKMTQENDAIPVPDLGTPEPNTPLPPMEDDIVPELPPRRKRRKREERETVPQSEPSQVPAPTMSPEEMKAISGALGLGFRVLFAMAASKRGAHWQLSADDERMLGEAWSEALAPWLARSAKYVPIAAAGFATLSVVMPRVQYDANMVATLRAQEIDANA